MTSAREQSAVAHDADRSRSVEQISDEELTQQREDANREASRAGNLRPNLRRAAVDRIIAIDTEQRRRLHLAALDGTPPHPLGPQEYADALKRSRARRFRAKHVADEQARIDTEEERRQLSLQIAAGAPASIPAADLKDTFGPRARLVSDGRLVLVDHGTTHWSLRTASNHRVVNGEAFIDPEHPRRTPKIRITAAEDLARRLADLRDSENQPAAFTAAVVDWVPGWRDRHGYDLRQAVQRVLLEWSADQPGVQLRDDREVQVPRGFPRERVAGGRADADGFYHRSELEVGPGDEIRIPDGAVHTVASTAYHSSSTPGGGYTAVAFTDSTRWNTPNTGYNRGVWVRFAGDPDSPQDRLQPGMGTSVTPDGAPLDVLDPGQRRAAERVLNTTPPGTRMHYQPERLSAFADNRPLIGTVTGGVIHEAGEWFAQIRCDDGTFTGVKLTSDDVTLHPNEKLVADARRQWGLNTEEAQPETGAPLAATRAANRQELDHLDQAIEPKKVTPATDRAAEGRTLSPSPEATGTPGNRQDRGDQQVLVAEEQVRTGEASAAEHLTGDSTAQSGQDKPDPIPTPPAPPSHQPPETTDDRQGTAPSPAVQLALLGAPEPVGTELGNNSSRSRRGTPTTPRPTFRPNRGHGR